MIKLRITREQLVTAGDQQSYKLNSNHNLNNYSEYSFCQLFNFSIFNIFSYKIAELESEFQT